MKNLYKRIDIFHCKYSTHAKFGYNVSAYHVLRVKNCYPQGCLYFKWKCKLINKGQSCIKGFQHVGQKCFGCKYYYDEKIHNQPELLISKTAYHDFLDELEEFEDWLEGVKGKNVDFWGTIKSIKPRFTKTINSDKSSINLEGYILHFDDVYLDRLHWEDHCYAIIYADQQQRFKFTSEDEIEFKCRVEIDRGRLIFKKIRSVEFRFKSKKTTWTNSKARVAKETASFFENQVPKCLHCDYGALIDVIDKSTPQWERRRELYCLKSFPSPDVCYYTVESFFELEEAEVLCP